MEAFSQVDLRIPYAAVMGIYETKQSVSMVHSYSRTYSHWELEEGRTISDGHEGCWTLKDSEDVYSFAVIHNGSQPQVLQVVGLTVGNHLVILNF